MSFRTVRDHIASYPRANVTAIIRSSHRSIVSPKRPALTQRFYMKENSMRRFPQFQMVLAGAARLRDTRGFEVP